MTASPPQPGIGITSDAQSRSDQPQAVLEQTFEKLLQSLLEMGICASDVQAAALESTRDGVAYGYPGGLMGRKVTQMVEQLSALESQKDLVSDVLIPLEVINYVDAGKNPHLYTKDFIERVSGENMYTNGMLSSVSDYRDILNNRMAESFPELAEYLLIPSSPQPPATAPPMSTSTSPLPSEPPPPPPPPLPNLTSPNQEENGMSNMILTGDPSPPLDSNIPQPDPSTIPHNGLVPDQFLLGVNSAGSDNAMVE